MPLKSTKALIYIWLLILAGNSFLLFTTQKNPSGEKPALSAVNVKLITDAFSESFNPDTDSTEDGQIDSSCNTFAIYLCTPQQINNLDNYPDFKKSSRFNIHKSRAPPAISPT